MSNYINQKTKVTTYAVLMFSITVIVAAASFFVLKSSNNRGNIRRSIGHTPEIVLNEISEHIEHQEDTINQHVENSQNRLDQHIQQAEENLDETMEKSSQVLGNLIPINND